jgi:hypothetical protein
VFCYVSGSRLDTEARDIGGGGMFVAMDDPGVVPPGALVGLAFDSGADAARTIFLFGRVVRKETGPRRGVGLRWESAATTAPAAELSMFLIRLLGVVPKGIETETTRDGRPGKSTYRFPEPPSRPAQPTAAQPGGTIAIKAVARTAGSEVHGRIVDLGQDSIRLLALKPPDRDLVRVSFRLSSPSGEASITCDCVVSGVEKDPRGLSRIDLLVRHVDEGDHRGVLARYVRWLRGRAETGAPAAPDSDSAPMPAGSSRRAIKIPAAAPPSPRP